MTFEDFEKAKRIQHRIAIASKNLDILREAADIAYKYPTQRSYTIRINNDSYRELDVDLELIEMAIEYYDEEIYELEAQFAALGKDNNNGIHT
jgi:hypothetical protein